MTTNVKFVCAMILFSAVGGTLLGVQQHEQPTVFLSAAAEKQAPAERSAPPPDNNFNRIPAQVKVTPAVVNFRAVPADTSDESGAQPMATRPRVTFQNGLLGIRAANSTMSDVLRAVQSATGAAINFPSVVNERVDVDVAPGRPWDVLASLLNGYDYVLVGSEQQPDSVARIIILTARRDFSDPSTTSNLPMSAAGQQPQAVQQSDTTKQPAPDTTGIVQQQKLQFEKQFGACIIQGCDAS